MTELLNKHSVYDVKCSNQDLVFSGQAYVNDDKAITGLEGAILDKNEVYLGTCSYTVNAENGKSNIKISDVDATLMSSAYTLVATAIKEIKEKIN